MSSSDDKKFLIRSSGHILGPFFKDEVITLIKKGQISIFDEVAEPYTIWYYLQDHADFKSIVHSMSMQTRLVNFLSSVSTKISQISKNTDDKTTDMTTEKTLTETKTKKDNLSLSEKQTASEVSVESIKPIQASPSSTSQYKSETESEEAVRKKVTVVVSWSWKFIVTAVFLVGAYITYKEFYKPFQKNKITANELHSRGLVFYKAGDFKRALPFYETAYSADLLTDEEKISLASMLIQEDKIPKAVAIKNEILDSSAFQETNGLLLDILIDYYQQNTSQFKNKIEFLIKNNSNNINALNIARFNLALFYWENKNYDKSIEYLNELKKHNYMRNIVDYLKALNLFSQKKLEELEKHITKDSGGVAFNSIIKEFKQEFYFLLAYIYMKKGDEQKLNLFINKLLNEDPFLYQEYQYSSFMAKNRLFNWLEFAIHCQEIYDFNPNNNLFKALFSFCSLKANHFKEGKNYLLQINKQKDSKNPLYLSLDIYLSMKKNKTNNEQLKDRFSLINYEKTKLPLAFILKARFFENQEDWETALSTWEQLLKFSPDNLSGKAGVAFNSYQIGNIVKGDMYRDKALEEYPYYAKLLAYKNKSF